MENAIYRHNSHWDKPYDNLFQEMRYMAFNRTL